MELHLFCCKDTHQQAVLLGVTLVTRSPEVEQYEWKKQVECNMEVAHIDVRAACEDQWIDDACRSRDSADESGSSTWTIRE